MFTVKSFSISWKKFCKMSLSLVSPKTVSIKKWGSWVSKLLRKHPLISWRDASITPGSRTLSTWWSRSSHKILSLCQTSWTRWLRPLKLYLRSCLIVLIHRQGTQSVTYSDIWSHRSKCRKPKRWKVISMLIPYQPSSSSWLQTICQQEPPKTGRDSKNILNCFLHSRCTPLNTSLSQLNPRRSLRDGPLIKNVPKLV